LPTVYKIAGAYLLVMNLLGCILACTDKKRAQSRQWRIPERMLFLVAVLGGCLGEYLTLLRIHHKTKHYRFMLGLPLILCAQVIGIALLFRTGILA